MDNMEQGTQPQTEKPLFKVVNLDEELLKGYNLKNKSQKLKKQVSEVADESLTSF